MAGIKGKTNKPLDEEVRNHNITIRLSKKELEKIEKIAKDLDMPKTRLIRNLTLSTLDEVNFMNKIGMLKGIKNILDFKERFLNPEKYRTLEINKS